MNRRPLFLQLFLTYMPLIVVGLFLLLLIVNNVIKNAYYEETERTLVNQAEIFSTFISNNSQGNFSSKSSVINMGKASVQELLLLIKEVLFWVILRKAQNKWTIIY